jgi:alpha-tubulin suppressor-like RCC1 family protein
MKLLPALPLLVLALFAVAACADRTPLGLREAPEAVTLAVSACELGVAIEEAYGLMDELIGQIDALEAEGALTRGQARALRNHLENARSHLQAGRTCPALAQLGAFREQVGTFVADEVLSDAEAEPLVAGATRIIDPPLPPTPPTELAMAAGTRHACGLNADGTVHCWGRNDVGQLGDGTTMDRLVPTPVTMPEGIRFASLHAGASFTCGLAGTGTGYCWGNNSIGQLGDGTTADRHTPRPVAIPGEVPLVALGLGGAHGCGLAEDGRAWCWGLNEDGQLGNGSTRSSTPYPVSVPEGVRFVSISGGTWHTCALSSTGDVYCWGRNEQGQLGDGTYIDRTVPGPVAMPAGVRFVEMTARGRGACGLAEEGTIYCWGGNFSGQLGDGTRTDRNAPAPVLAPAGVLFVSAETGAAHSCARDATGNAYCWGLNNFGQLGDGTTAMRLEATLVQAPLGVTFTSLSPGEQFTCGITSEGEAYCWGDNISGQLGDGTQIGRQTPTQVVGWP